MQWWWVGGGGGLQPLSDRRGEIELFRHPSLPPRAPTAAEEPAGFGLLWLRIHRRVFKRAPYLALSNPDGPTADCCPLFALQSWPGSREI